MPCNCRVVVTQLIPAAGYFNFAAKNVASASSCMYGITRLYRPWSTCGHVNALLVFQKLVRSAVSPVKLPNRLYLSKSSETLHSIASQLIQNVAKTLQKRAFAPPLAYLNTLNHEDSKTLVSELSQKVEKQLESFRSNDHQPVAPVSFINPRLQNVAGIIQDVADGRVPDEILQIYNFLNHEETLDSIMAKLLYKEYIEQNLYTIQPQNSLVDLSSPASWFPEARKMKRKLVLHVGPTNSGKTYNSLQELAKSKSGYYAGPLRLLAREIYERFNQQGIRCNLITGEEVVPSIDEVGKVSDISSGTIEMIPLHKPMDTCVIDEIQMIADDRRGSAWTGAVLGVQAKVIHMCGEQSAVPLIKKLANITGDELEIKTYERLGKLTVAQKELHLLKKLAKGDCVIAFSKRKILELKCEIEKMTKFRVGVIYGALPPEIRSKEANGFNSGQYDILVASDAVGMGLNLKIKRVVFFTTTKFNGSETVPLTASATKQIAGRAGRFSAGKGQLEGFVTALKAKDLRHVRKMMAEPNQDLVKACIWPTNKIWMLYMSKFPQGTSFYEILSQFAHETADVKMSDFFVTELDERFDILKLFLKKDLFKKTMIEDQLTLSLAPINIRMASKLIVDTAFDFFETISKCETKTIFDFHFLHTKLLEQEPRKSTTAEETVERLRLLEENHKLVLIFLWLSQRWPTLFVDKESATDVKTLIEKRISEELINLRQTMKKTRRRR